MGVALQSDDFRCGRGDTVYQPLIVSRCEHGVSERKQKAPAGCSSLAWKNYTTEGKVESMIWFHKCVLGVRIVVKPYLCIYDVCTPTTRVSKPATSFLGSCPAFHSCSVEKQGDEG